MEQELPHRVQDYFEPESIERFKHRVFKLANDIEVLAKRSGDKIERPWKTEETILAGLTTYKEKHCWRNIFKLEKENVGAYQKTNTVYDINEAWKTLILILDNITTSEILSRKIGANVGQIRNHLRQAYETRLVAIGFTRIKAMESV